MKLPIMATLHRPMPALPDGWYELDSAIGLAGELLVVATEGPPASMQAVPGKKTRAKYFPLHLLVASDDGVRQVRLMGADSGRFRFAMAQPLPDDHWLLCNSRIGPLGESRNASVFDSQGRCVRSFRVGDAVQGVQTAANGDTWVSYFDEGAGESFPSYEGLVRFGADGRPTDTFNRQTSSPLGPPNCLDCYAFNVASDQDVWLYYYTDFPLVHLHGGRVAEWWNDTPVDGAGAIAVANGRAAFYGGYGSENDGVLSVASIGSPEAKRWTLVDPDGVPLGRDRCRRAVGRGPILYLLTPEAAYCLDIRRL